MTTYAECDCGTRTNRRTADAPRTYTCQDCLTAARRAKVQAALDAGLGIPAAAQAARMHPDTVRRLVREGAVVVRPVAPPSMGRWRERALCANHSRPSLWDGETREDVAAARAVCRRCPVVDDCRAEAARLDRTGEAPGVWGGMTAAERAWIRSVPPPPRLTGDALYRAALGERYDLDRLTEETA